MQINPVNAAGTEEATDGKGISLGQLGLGQKHQIQMLHETYEPGAHLSEELYQHEAEEAGMVISGEIELTVGSKVEILKRGDGYVFDSRKPYRFRNKSKRRCIIVSACTPSSFQCKAAIAPGGAPNHAR